MYIDKNNKELKVGDVIDIHQTVNGENIFIIASLEPLDIRYGYDPTHIYQYDTKELLKTDRYTGETEFEIIHNLYGK